MTQVNQPSSSRPVTMPSGIVAPVSSSSSKPHGFHSARAHAHQSNLPIRDTSSSQGRYHTRRNGAAGDRDRVHAQTSARDRRARSPSVVHILDSDGEESDDDEIQLPARQLRSPTPPTRVQHHARGIRFTEEDHTFFLKTLQWEFQNSPRASRDDVCRKMASKVRVASDFAEWQLMGPLPRLATTTPTAGRGTGAVTRVWSIPSARRPQRRHLCLLPTMTREKQGQTVRTRAPTTNRKMARNQTMSRILPPTRMLRSWARPVTYILTLSCVSSRSILPAHLTGCL